MQSSFPTRYNCRIDTAHPCLAGHFPGNPIVPAVVILDEVAAVLERQNPGEQVSAIPVAKFSRPLRPGETFVIRLGALPDGKVWFDCSSRQGLIAAGQMELRPCTSRQ